MMSSADATTTVAAAAARTTDLDSLYLAFTVVKPDPADRQNQPERRSRPRAARVPQRRR